MKQVEVETDADGVFVIFSVIGGGGCGNQRALRNGLKGGQGL